MTALHRRLLARAGGSAPLARAAWSMGVFSVYLLVLGALLTFVPNPTLRAVGLPPTDEVWIQLLGLTALGLAYHYASAALYPLDLVQFYRWSVWTRAVVPLCFAAFVVLDRVGPALLAFGVGDAIGAAWTGLALRHVRISTVSHYSEGTRRLIARLPEGAPFHRAERPEARHG